MREDSARTQAKILDAADELFGSLGFDATSTRQIGDQSGVNKALIHYHFATKQALFNAVLDRYYDRLALVISGVLARPGSVRERMYGLLDAYVDFLRDNQAFSRMVQREIAGGRHLDKILAHMTPLFASGAVLLEQAYPATRSGELAGSQLLISFYGMVVTYFTYSPAVAGLLATDPLSPESLALRKRHLRRMADLVLTALEANSTTSAPAPKRGRRNPK